jgi:hypothetical protein
LEGVLLRSGATVLLIERCVLFWRERASC